MQLDAIWIVLLRLTQYILDILWHIYKRIFLNVEYLKKYIRELYEREKTKDMFDEFNPIILDKLVIMSIRLSS